MSALPVTFALLSALAASPCEERDDQGREFPVCFDPWQGLEVGGAGLLSPAGTGGVEVAPEFSASIRFRGRRDSRSKAGSTWLVAQRFAAFDLAPVQRQAAFTLTAWEGLFRRHQDEGALTIPTNPPFLVPFPFDVSLAGRVVRWERRVAEGRDWALEAGRMSLLLDVLRSPSGRFHLALGPTAAWRVRSVAGEIRHDVTPLTAGHLVVNLESDDGLWALRGQALVGTTIDPLSPAAPVLRGQGELALERVLLAINDQPVAIVVGGRGAWNDAGASASTEWRATVGLLVRFWSDRD